MVFVDNRPSILDDRLDERFFREQELSLQDKALGSPVESQELVASQLMTESREKVPVKGIPVGSSRSISS
jgi:hypothetical protein